MPDSARAQPLLLAAREEFRASLNEGTDPVRMFEFKAHRDVLFACVTKAFLVDVSPRETDIARSEAVRSVMLGNRDNILIDDGSVFEMF